MADDRGWAFPVEIDPLTGRVREVGGEEKVRQSIRMILGTNPGERYLYPGFGCGLNRYVFSLADYTLLRQIERDVKTNITRWEKRITFLEVKASAEDRTRIMLDITYKVQDIEHMFRYSQGFDLR